LCGIVGSGTDHLPPAPVSVGSVTEAQHGHWPSKLGKIGSDPVGDKADNILAVPIATTDPIYKSPLESNSEGGGKVYMVVNGEELSDKTIEEI
jgi:hypothetical protein